MKLVEKLKEVLASLKKWVWVAIAGIVIAAVAWRAHVVNELQNAKQTEDEQKVKNDAAAKLAETEEKIEKEKKEKVVAIELEKEEKLKNIKKEEKEEKKKLEELSKKNKDKFKKTVEEKLGVKEKKKGRPKK